VGGYGFADTIALFGDEGEEDAGEDAGEPHAAVEQTECDGADGYG
jgi:hypothetical protein